MEHFNNLTFEDNTRLEYGPGSFDNWCVYYTDENGIKKPLHDVDYFSQLKSLSLKFGVERIYNDYVQIYNDTNRNVEEKMINRISDIASRYEDSKLEIKKVFSELYMTMISEENKKYTKLGKKIKRLGIYVLLFEEKDAYAAANFMKGMKAEQIRQMCVERGF